MLVVGAFFGRAGGIIALGLVAAVGLGRRDGRRSEVDPDTVTERPATAADVDSRYSLGAGEQRIDLRRSPTSRTSTAARIKVDGDVGAIEVTLPQGVARDVDADVDGPGGIRLFGDERGGVDVQDQQRRRLRPRTPPSPGHRARRGRDRGDALMSTTTYPTTHEKQSGRHPVNVGHLVMGIAFLAIVGVWALIQSDVVDGADVRWLLPVPWVLAGLGRPARPGADRQPAAGSTRQTGWVDSA